MKKESHEPMSYVKCKIAFEIAFFVFQKYLGGGEEKQLSDFRKMFPFKTVFNNMFQLIL